RKRRTPREINGIREHGGRWNQETWIFHLSLPRAGRRHLCDYCGQRIEKGQLHVSYVTTGVEGPGMETWRLHGECYLANGAMFYKDGRPGWRWPDEQNPDT